MALEVEHLLKLCHVAQLNAIENHRPFFESINLVSVEVGGTLSEFSKIFNAAEGTLRTMDLLLARADGPMGTGLPHRFVNLILRLPTLLWSIARQVEFAMMQDDQSSNRRRCVTNSLRNPRKVCKIWTLTRQRAGSFSDWKSLIYFYLQHSSW